MGKSSVAVHLAFALNRMGLQAGLVDADIYGPSIPRMMFPSSSANVTEPPRVVQDNLMEPIRNYGIPCMSMGFLVTQQDKALAWRGAMINKAMHQLVRGVSWPNLDVLVVDLPPGKIAIILHILGIKPITPFL